jgi:hypothetical protein
MGVASGCSAGRVEMGKAPKLIRILAVDDHALLRKEHAAVINAEPEKSRRERSRAMSPIILSKPGASDRAHAVRIALKRRMIEL